MGLTVVTGQASNVALGSDLAYAPSGQYGPIPVKTQLVSLRIDGRPVLFRTRTLPSISDGDRVSAAGKDAGGTVEAPAMRNLTTGATYATATTGLIVVAIVVIVFGVPLIAACGIGLFFIAMGGWVLYKAIQIRKATAMLATPESAGGAAA